LLADNPHGATEEVLVLGHGFKRQMLASLVRAKLAKRCRVTIKARARTIGVSYIIITAAGRRAINGED
jgi:hypothetical protein